MLYSQWEAAKAGPKVSHVLVFISPPCVEKYSPVFSNLQLFTQHLLDFYSMGLSPVLLIFFFKPSDWKKERKEERKEGGKKQSSYLPWLCFKQ